MKSGRRSPSPRGLGSVSPARLLLFFSLWTSSVTAKCYWPNGQEASSDWAPCVYGTVSTCCYTPDSDTCSALGLCLQTNLSQVRYFRQACTSKDWNSPGCLNLCPWIDNGPAELTSCGKNTFCCGSSNTSCCEENRGVTLAPIAGQIVLKNMDVSEKESKVPVALGAGLGLGLGIPLIIAILVLFYILRRRQAQVDSFRRSPSPAAALLPTSNPPRRKTPRGPIPSPIIIKRQNSSGSSIASNHAASLPPPIWPPHNFIKHHFQSISRKNQSLATSRQTRHIAHASKTSINTLGPREMPVLPATPKAFEIASSPDDYINELPCKRFSDKSSLAPLPNSIPPSSDKPKKEEYDLPTQPLPSYGQGLKLRTAGSGFPARRQNIVSIISTNSRSGTVNSAVPSEPLVSALPQSASAYGPASASTLSPISRIHHSTGNLRQQASINATNRSTSSLSGMISGGGGGRNNTPTPTPTFGSSASTAATATDHRVSAMADHPPYHSSNTTSNRRQQGQSHASGQNQRQNHNQNQNQSQEQHRPPIELEAGRIYRNDESFLSL